MRPVTERDLHTRTSSEFLRGRIAKLIPLTAHFYRYYGQVRVCVCVGGGGVGPHLFTTCVLGGKIEGMQCYY